MFIAAASNPELADLATISAATRERSFRTVAALVNRILLAACRRETVEAVRHEGQAGLAGAFQALGQTAGEEMMATPQAQEILSGLDRYLDSSGLEAVGREAATRPPI